MADERAEGLFLGCVEIGILVSQVYGLLPHFNTFHIHALAAAQFALLASDAMTHARQLIRLPQNGTASLFWVVVSPIRLRLEPTFGS